jgi:hypothetical protein
VDGRRRGQQVAAHPGGPIATQADSAFVDGIHIALLYAAGLVLVSAALVVALLPRRDASVPADDDTEPADRVPATV